METLLERASHRQRAGTNQQHNGRSNVKPQSVHLQKVSEAKKIEGGVYSMMNQQQQIQRKYAKKNNAQYNVYLANKL